MTIVSAKEEDPITGEGAAGAEREAEEMSDGKNNVPAWHDFILTYFLLFTSSAYADCD